MNISNNFFFFLINNLIFDNKELSKTLLSKNELLKLFSIKKKYKIINSSFKNVDFLFFFNLKNLNINNKVLFMNKNNILFFLFNNKLYHNNNLNLILNNNFLKINLKNYYLFFYFFYLSYIKKFIFLLKFINILKRCQP